MRRRIFLLALAAAILPFAAASAQPTSVKDPAELFPPDSLLYVEVVKPAEISREVAKFIKGSVVEDMTDFMANWHEKKGEGYFMVSEMVATFSAFAGPEALAEYKRMQGAAFAITGLDKKNDPEWALVLLAGDSHVPNFIMRMYMTVDPMIRVAGKVEGIRVYWESRGAFQAVGPGGVAPPQPPEQPSGPMFASMPGAIVVGSSLETVGDVIKRMKGKEKRLSLLGAAGFKEADALRQRPGVFAFANPGRAMDVFEAAFKNNELSPIERRAVAQLLNPKAVRFVAANLGVSDGLIDFQLTVATEAGKPSPLLELIADQRISPSALQAVPKNSIGVFTIGLKDGDKQFYRLLTLADTIVGNDGPKPSDQVKAIEQQLKASIAKEILGRIAAITVAMPQKQELPKGAMEIPMLIVTANDPAAAEQLEKLVPVVLGLASGEPLEPVTESIRGQKVHSVSGRAFPWKGALHYGRGGSSLILGLDRKLVAASIVGAPKDSVADEPRIMEAVKAHEKSAFIGIYRWGNLLPGWFSELGQERQFVKGKLQGPDPEKLREKAKKLRESMAPLIQEMPPLVVSLSRQGEKVVFGVRQRHQPGASAKLIDGLLDAMMSSATDMFKNIGNGVGPAPPPPPIKN